MRKFLIFLMAATGLGLIVSGFAAAQNLDPLLASPVNRGGVMDVENPTYYGDVKAIIDANCLSCHIEGGIGAAEFVLDDPLVVQDNARDIAMATYAGVMPPWLPSDESLPFLHQRGLTDEEITTLVNWSRAGAPLGDPAAAAELNIPPLPTLRSDITAALPEPYTPNASLNDDYRCFISEAEISENTFITGYQVTPDASAIVHHVLVFVADKNSRAYARGKDAVDAQPGWQCFGGSGVGEDAVVATWAPGAMPVFQPEGTGYPVQAGDYFIIQVHYSLVAPAEPDQTRIDFQLAQPGEEIEMLYTVPLTAPVEIPCPAGIDTPECTREFALDYAEQYYGAGAEAGANYDLMRCGQSLSAIAKQDASAITSSCDFENPADVYLVEVLPHMHTRGVSIKLELYPDTPDAITVIDIPAWDFHWQGSYQLAEPLFVPQGVMSRLTCVWDNTREKNPRYIVWGEGTQDEMCLAYVTLMAAGN